MNSQVNFPGERVSFKNAIRLPVAHFAVCRGKAQKSWLRPPSSDDFADSVHGVGIAFRVLWGEAFVGMFMSCENQVGVCREQVFQIASARDVRRGS